MKDFRETCLSGAPVLDGAMGTYIQQMGGDLFGAKNNLDHPDLVRQVHDDYIVAGSQMITTNTFSLNEIYMVKKAFEADAMDVSLNRAMEIACDSASAAESTVGKIHVLGGFGPCGELFMRGRCKNYENEQVVESIFRAETMCNIPYQILLETFFDLTESKFGRSMQKIESRLADYHGMTLPRPTRWCNLMGNRSAQIAEGQ
jgi:methionine synthase I (cobalamin-dependent)